MGLKPTPAAPNGIGKRKGSKERTPLKNSGRNIASHQIKKRVAVPKTGRKKGGRWTERSQVIGLKEEEEEEELEEAGPHK